MSFEVTVTPTVYDVEVAVNPSVQPFDVEVTVGNVPDLDLTTNGDSGASTFDPLTGELNIPNYTLDGLGGVPESRTLTINGTTQDLSANRTFTIPAPDPVTIGSPANGLAIDGNQVLTIGLASGSQAGALSSTDWSTFNNKQNAIGYTPENVANKAINFTSPDDTKYPTTLAVSTALAGKQDVLTNPITGTGVAGQVSFWTGTGTQSGDNGLFWDNSTKNFRINQSTDAGFRLDVNGTARVQGELTVNGVNIGLGGGNVDTNTIVGRNAGLNNTTGTSNSFFGRDAGRNNTTGVNNSFFGRAAGFANTTGNDNSFFGLFAGQNNTTGISNSFFGLFAGQNNTTGSYNSFFGLNAGQYNTTGGNNSFFGRNAGLNNTTGGNNSFFGVSAGRFLANGSTSLTIANNSVFLGVNTRANADNETNQIVIGHTAIGLGSNTTVIGNSSTTFGRWWGNLLLGTSTNAGFTLDVAGTSRIQATADSTPLTISGYSLTGSNTQSALSITGTWNTTGTPTALLMNITDTASNGNSLFLDFRTTAFGSMFVITKGGRVGVASITAYIGTTISLTGSATVTGLTTDIGLFKTISKTTGDHRSFYDGNSFQPTSGTATFNSFLSNGIINQTGGASGITRGLYVNPTLTSAFDWRSIEWNNNTGWGLYGGGTANNYLNGKLLVKTNVDAGFDLDVNGTARVQGAITTGAPTGGTAKPFKIGAVATVTPTSPNRTIEIEIDGTTYYLTAKTTND